MRTALGSSTEQVDATLKGQIGLAIERGSTDRATHAQMLAARIFQRSSLWMNTIAHPVRCANVWRNEFEGALCACVKCGTPRSIAVDDTISKFAWSSA